ncbi:MAG: hypothetical protein QOF89_3560 [Acidobacteriota bacterium]|nr:hypothetical protein [Acidobacteriota bacterium]
MTIRPFLFLAVAFATSLAAEAGSGPFGVVPPVVRPGPPQVPSDPDRWLPWPVFTWREGVKPGAPALTQDTQGYIWAGTPEGLVRYNGQAWQCVEVPGKPAPVFAITGRRDGSLWIGQPPDSQVYRLKNGVWTLFDQRSGIPPGVVEVLIETVEGNRSTLWVGTSLGLARCQARGLPWTRRRARRLGGEFPLRPAPFHGRRPLAALRQPLGAAGQLRFEPPVHRSGYRGAGALGDDPRRSRPPRS